MHFVLRVSTRVNGFRWEDMRDSGQIMELTRLFSTAFLLPETSLNWIIFFCI